MKGADEFGKLLKTGQYKRLYFVSSLHARGRIFRIFVLPKDTKAIPNGNNAPLNKDAVEVYGIIGGQPGWTEVYGWLHKGPWQDDFYELLEAKKKEKIEYDKRVVAEKASIIADKKQRELELLSNY